MENEVPDPFARRARLSSKAIATAVLLTLAAAIAIAIASHETTTADIKTMGPVTRLPIDSTSVLVPVVDR
jgi:hypothetical protein